jgi:ParB-like nuclease domain
VARKRARASHQQQLIAKPAKRVTFAERRRASKPKDSELQPALPLDDIIVGERHRRDMGDVDGLAANMADVGLLHPIVVTPDGVLMCGERRLRAAKLLGWKKIPVTIRSKP